jgi:hypothetical protein
MKSDNLIWLDEPSPFFICGDAEIEKGSWFFSFNFLQEKSYELKLLAFYEKNKAVSTRRFFVID